MKRRHEVDTDLRDMVTTPIKDRLGTTIEVSGHDEVTQNMWRIGWEKLHSSLNALSGRQPIMWGVSNEVFTGLCGFEIKDKCIDNAIHIGQEFDRKIGICIEINRRTLRQKAFEYLGGFQHKGELNGGFSTDPFQRFGHGLLLEVFGQCLCVVLGRTDAQGSGLKTAFFRASWAIQLASSHIDDERRYEAHFLPKMEEVLIDSGGGRDTAVSRFPFDSIDAAFSGANLAILKQVVIHG